jgi:uncharacterized membrane protein YoaK (UPF0700 family)
MTMGGVFTANMTGNTVLAGIALAQRGYPEAWRHIAPLFCFFLGAMASRALLRLARRFEPSLVLEALLLAGVDFLPVGLESKVLIVAFAMGIQAAAVTRFGGDAVSTVVVTSTLTRAAEVLLDRLWRDRLAAHPPLVTHPRLLALTWAGYFLGALIGALLVPLIAWPLLVPAAILIAALAL